MKQPDRLIDKIEEIYFLGNPVSPVIEKKVRGFCKLPYYRHQEGCINFGKRPDCPPGAPFFGDLYEGEVLVAAVGFNLANFVERRKLLHPDWTQRELENPRHWQEHVRMHLRQFVKTIDVLEKEPIFNPEAMGINVTDTCQKAGLKLEWPPKNWVYKVAFLAKRHSQKP